MIVGIPPCASFESSLQLGRLVRISLICMCFGVFRTLGFADIGEKAAAHAGLKRRCRAISREGEERLQIY
jgi:hypothetical protein